MKVKMYARDLVESLRTDGFMGEGFEEAMRVAQETGDELVIGEFYDNSEWRVE